MITETIIDAKVTVTESIDMVKDRSVLGKLGYRGGNFLLFISCGIDAINIFQSGWTTDNQVSILGDAGGWLDIVFESSAAESFAEASLLAGVVVTAGVVAVIGLAVFATLYWVARGGFGMGPDQATAWSVILTGSIMVGVIFFMILLAL